MSAKCVKKEERNSKGSFLSGHPKKSLEDSILVAQPETKVPSQGAPATTWVLSWKSFYALSPNCPIGNNILPIYIIPAHN